MLPNQELYQKAAGTQGGEACDAIFPTIWNDNDLGKLSSSGAAKSAAIPAGNLVVAPELAEIANHWPALPQAIREEVLALLRRARPNT